MKPSRECPATKPADKPTAPSVRKGAASAEAPAPPVDDATRLCSNRPVKASGRSGRLETPSNSSACSTEGVAAATPSVSALSSRPAAPTKPPSRKAYSTPPGEATNILNFGSSTSSMATEKTAQRSFPPALPVYRGTTSRENTLGCNDESEADIREFSRSYLTRLSLEDAVVAVERLRFLMMSHTAAVAASRGENSGTAEVLPPQQTHVDPFKLSKRPLEEIAEELCSQLRSLTSAYVAASAADRCLLGVPDVRRPAQFFITRPTAQEQSTDVTPVASGAEAVPDAGDVDALLGTFGPMVSTQHMTTTVRSNADGNNLLDPRNSLEAEDNWGNIDLNKPNPGPRIAYPRRDYGEGGPDFGSTVYKYPNGMIVSYPVSTFGELVSTESGQGTTFRSRGTTILGSEVRATVSDGTQTDDTLGPTKKEKELQAYVKALEGRLTEKQRLEAIKESRGAKKRGISETLFRLARSADSANAE